MNEIIQSLFQSASYWGYATMFLLMILEGPIATLSAAFLASLGYFNPFIVFWLSVFGDIIGDIILYYLGYYGGRPLLEKAERFLKIKESIVKRMEGQFAKRGAKIIFSVKATVGLVYITFILAGATRMNLKKFITYSFLGGLVWSSFLVLVGYFFGYAAEKINEYISYAGIIIFIIAVSSIIFINLYKKKQTNKIFE